VQRLGKNLFLLFPNEESQIYVGQTVAEECCHTLVLLIQIKKKYKKCEKL
jgi:hypothetical protein